MTCLKYSSVSFLPRNWNILSLESIILVANRWIAVLAWDLHVSCFVPAQQEAGVELWKVLGYPLLASQSDRQKVQAEGDLFKNWYFNSWRMDGWMSNAREKLGQLGLWVGPKWSHVFDCCQFQVKNWKLGGQHYFEGAWLWQEHIRGKLLEAKSGRHACSCEDLVVPQHDTAFPSAFNLIRWYILSLLHNNTCILSSVQRALSVAKWKVWRL